MSALESPLARGLCSSRLYRHQRTKTPSIAKQEACPTARAGYERRISTAAAAMGLVIRESGICTTSVPRSRPSIARGGIARAHVLTLASGNGPVGYGRTRVPTDKEAEESHAAKQRRCARRCGRVVPRGVAGAMRATGRWPRAHLLMAMVVTQRTTCVRWPVDASTRAWNSHHRRSLPSVAEPTTTTKQRSCCGKRWSQGGRTIGKSHPLGAATRRGTVPTSTCQGQARSRQTAA